MNSIDRLIARVARDATSGLPVPTTATALLTTDQVAKVRETPHTPLLVRTIDAVYGAVTTRVAPDGSVRHELPPMPANAKEAIPEIKLRIAATKLHLQRAPEDTIRSWVLAVASSMESKLDPRALNAEVAVCVGQFDLPACCFTRQSQLEVIRVCGPWFPKFAKMLPVVEGYAKPLLDYLGRLEALLKHLTTMQPPALTHGGGGKRTESEVAGWLDGVEREPPDFARLVKVKAFRTRLAREDYALAAQFAERFDMLADTGSVPPIARKVPGQAPRPEPKYPEPTPEVLAARAKARAAAGATDYDAIAAQFAGLAKSVDLTDRRVVVQQAAE